MKYDEFRALIRPRARVLIDNDFSGDPDDLFQTAHHLLSPSVEVVGLIGSHLSPGDFLDPSPVSAENAVRRAADLLEVMGLTGNIPLYLGSNVGLSDPLVPIVSEASQAIVAEALRDHPLPLFLVCGAGLTDLASALLTEPRIADRMTVVWIGGNEHPDLAVPPPGARGPEYNLRIDLKAAQTVFGLTGARLWQVPRDAYRQCLVPWSELVTRVRPRGRLGAFLYEAIDGVRTMTDAHGYRLGEVYVMGDQPLVGLTALQSAFEPSPSSCAWVDRDTPTILDTGEYGPGTGSRPLRVFTRLDTRTLFEDFYCKLELWAGTETA